MCSSSFRLYFQLVPFNMSVTAHHALPFSHPFIYPSMHSFSSNNNIEVEKGRKYWGESRCWEIRKGKTAGSVQER